MAGKPAGGGIEDISTAPIHFLLGDVDTAYREFLQRRDASRAAPGAAPRASPGFALVRQNALSSSTVLFWMRRVHAQPLSMEDKFLLFGMWGRWAQRSRIGARAADKRVGDAHEADIDVVMGDCMGGLEDGIMTLSNTTTAVSTPTEERKFDMLLGDAMEDKGDGEEVDKAHRRKRADDAETHALQTSEPTRRERQPAAEIALATPALKIGNPHALQEDLTWSAVIMLELAVIYFGDVEHVIGVLLLLLALLCVQRCRLASGS